MKRISPFYKLNLVTRTSGFLKIAAASEIRRGSPADSSVPAGTIAFVHITYPNFQHFCLERLLRLCLPKMYRT